MNGENSIFAPIIVNVNIQPRVFQRFHFNDVNHLFGSISIIWHFTLFSFNMYVYNFDIFNNKVFRNFDIITVHNSEKSWDLKRQFRLHFLCENCQSQRWYSMILIIFLIKLTRLLEWA